MNYEPLDTLPVEIQAQYGSQLHREIETVGGHFYLSAIRQTQPKTYEELRLVVLVVDENGFPIPGVKVAFSYDSANFFTIDDQFKWSPPTPWRADIFPTGGGGQIEHIQGSVIKPGEPGGVTVYVVEPEYSSDHVTGCGALADHSGLHLTFQLRRAGVVPMAEKIKELEDRLAALEATL